MFADQKPAIIILFKMIRSNNYSSSILPKWMIYNFNYPFVNNCIKNGFIV